MKENAEGDEKKLTSGSLASAKSSNEGGCCV